MCGICGTPLKKKATLRQHEHEQCHKNVGKCKCSECGKVTFSNY